MDGIDNHSLSGVKRRGRQPGSKNKHPATATIEGISASTVDDDSLPVFKSSRRGKFKCKWKKCSADLHNLATLRAHLFKVHLPTKKQLEDGEEYACWWKHCKHLLPTDDGRFELQYAYETEVEWKNHIEEDHIYPIALGYGDGPSTTHIDPIEIQRDKQRFLSDANGRIVTPSISMSGNDDLPADTLTLIETLTDGEHGNQRDRHRRKADQTAQSQFFKAHNISKNSKQSAEEVVRAMTVRKEKIGPGIDKGGCTLINDAMRQTFVQNPGISRVIDIDD